MQKIQYLKEPASIHNQRRIEYLNKKVISGWHLNEHHQEYTTNHEKKPLYLKGITHSLKAAFLAFTVLEQMSTLDIFLQQ